MWGRARLRRRRSFPKFDRSDAEVWTGRLSDATGDGSMRASGRRHYTCLSPLKRQCVRRKCELGLAHPRLALHSVALRMYSMAKPRILALHGFRTSASVLKSQVCVRTWVLQAGGEAPKVHSSWTVNRFSHYSPKFTSLYMQLYQHLHVQGGMHSCCTCTCALHARNVNAGNAQQPTVLLLL